MFRRALTCAGAVAAATGVLATAAQAAGPPLPKSANGKPVQLVAGGLTTPTSFAFGGGAIFEGDGGSEAGSPGGVYLVKPGAAVRLPGSPGFVSGLAWRKGTLYVAAGNQILAWSGFNGATFSTHKTIYTGSKKFSGFNGLAFGPDGRLYAGISVGTPATNDHGPANTPYLYDIVSMNTSGKAIKVYARGMRQPWQLAFAPGDSRPFVTDFGRDCSGPNPCPQNAKPPAVPDFVLHVKQGDNYGFPKCDWTKSCKGFTKPFKFFAPHTDNGGIAIVGNTVYLGQFGFDAPAHNPQVVTMSTSGGKVKPFLTGTPVPILAIGASGGYLYVGAAGQNPGEGFVYRVQLTSPSTTKKPAPNPTSPAFTG